MNKCGWVSARLVFLTASIIFILFWIIYGFDSVVENIYNEYTPQTYGIGFHWSTLHAIILSMYVTTINLQTGGISSLKHLYYEILLDLKCVIWDWNAWEFNLSRRVMKGISYPGINAFWSGIFPGLMYSIFVAVLALFVFEFPYVLLLNWYQYGSWMFPVYQYNVVGGISTTLFRNIVLLLFPLAWCIVTPYSFGYRFRYRLDKTALFLSVICVSFFLVWIIMPHADYVSETEINNMLEGPIIIYPIQDKFPQTTYIYLNTSGVHDRNDIDGFWVNDPPVHAVNVLTKYQVFILVGYILCVKVERH